ncbi:ArsR/SmtB family transcription factor [Tetragenococcus halophilus]|uniref:ArsR/SmtB family transcription factor n=1 Tax=Tetragenococcus halophilus TaxID=51669 RepID=UPI000CBBB0FC|nr:metalloregulator ArsR/SmtB family transcription factor [Tetragenococcus halophilus]MCO8296798.1 helix-turn-helix transcriptional regulator [Tetragenococcus halophilus]RQD30563.1 transcriptional regulator [Tetragenococcus halophilus subsp. halophilus DSM 20339]GBD58727.1 Transcriptional regulator, ArsR family [Tetragenococcus halophilus subsp. halophilus]
MTEVCQTTIIHPEKVDVVKNKLENKDLSNLLVLGKCFSDPSRIKIFYALETFKEICVCDLAETLDASIATTSHHLRYLKKYGMTKSRQDGKVVYYSLANEDVIFAVQTFLNLSEKITTKF